MSKNKTPERVTLVIYPTPRSTCCDAVIEPGTTHEDKGVEVGACTSCNGFTRIRWDHPANQETKS